MNFLYDILFQSKLAIKNIWRNRKRSALTIASICIGTVALILVGGYVAIMAVGLKEEAIGKQYGHIQIARTGYFEADDTSPDHLMSKKEFEAIEDFLWGLPETDMVNKRLHIAGIIGNMEKSAVFMAVCGDPENEIFMLPSVMEGEPLSPLDPAGINIGRGLAKKLDVSTEDNLLLFFASESGAQEAIYVSVRGIYKGLMKDQENIMIYVPLQSAWDLMLEQKVHRILLFLRSEEDIGPVLEKINGFIIEQDLDLEARSWEDLAVFFEQILDLFRNLILVAGVIIFIVIIFGISNTMYMVISERTREIGTLRAIGKTRGELMRGIFFEGVLMGILGAAIGVALSSILIPVINSLDLTLPPGPGQDERIPVVILFHGKTILIVIMVNILTAAAASILPAIKVTRKKITDALR
jgi:putative ABC transport system permease protein